MADNLTNEQLELLAKALEELRKTTVMSEKTQAEVAAAAAKDANELEKNAKAVSENTSVGKEFVRDLSGLGSELGSAIDQIRNNREDFRSLNPAIRAAGTVFGATGKAVGSMAESAGDAVQGMAGMTKSFKGFSAAMVGGGLLKGFGSGLKSGSEAAANMAVAFGEFATGELQNVVEAYRKVGSAGAIGAGGMNELYESSNKLGIGLAGMSEIISKNGAALAYAGGSTLAGRKALVNLTENSKAYEDQLLALGYTFTEMRDQSAKFLERNQILGLADTNDKRRMAEANNAYMLQLDQLSRITGKSRDEIAKQLDQQMKDVRFQATLRTLEAKNGKENREAVENIAATIGAQQGEYARKGFMDAMSGAINTPEAQSYLQTLDEGGRQTMQNLRNGAIKQTSEGFTGLIESQQRWYEGKGGDAVFGRLSNMGSSLDPMIGALMKAKTYTKEQLDAQGRVLDEQQGAMKADDQATKDTIAAQKKLQAMGQKLDEIVRQNVLPHAATAVNKFTTAIEDFVNVASKALGIKSTGPLEETGYADTAAGYGAGAQNLGANSKAISDVMSARTKQKKDIYASDEFKQWQKSKGGGGLTTSGMEDKEYGVGAYMKEKGIEEVPMPGGSATGSTQQILDTIKQRESSGNYQAQAKGSSASGAYQFIDSTWQSLTKKYGIGAEFARAGDAPPQVQDAVAAKYVDELLQKAGGDVSKVPLAWYTGNIQGKMSDKALAANNGLTPEKYQEKWMADFGKLAGAQLATAQPQQQPQQMSPERAAELKQKVLESRMKMAVKDPNGKVTTQPVKDDFDAPSQRDKAYQEQLAAIEAQNTNAKMKLAEAKARVMEARKNLAYKDPNGKVIVQSPTEPFAASGGVFSGPKSGYSATLHGNEAVVPLSSNNQMPVEMNSMGDLFEEQNTLMADQTAGLEELLRTLRQTTELSQRILRVSQA